MFAINIGNLKKKSKRIIFLKKHEDFLLLTVSGVINMKNI